MSNLICPISPETTDKRASRVGAVLTATLLVVYAATGVWPLLVFVVADYVVRVLTPYRAPIARLGAAAVRITGRPPKPMNKGPKIFAWRIGFLMAAVSLVLLPVSPTASAIVAAALAGFNVLDGVGNLCVGCVIYTYLVLPYFGPPDLDPATTA
jgi:hypothetical protein